MPCLAVPLTLCSPICILPTVLSHNSIEEVADAEFKQLVELRKLSLSHNALRVVPNLVVR